ncbi:MAG TPA: GNAT family N-acetyltransferase [Bryobacteraceae bacterium]|jgi:RimJ/RimL family protein N-acetyltransferase
MLLETRRLLLKPLAPADANQIQKIFPRWEIVQFLNASIPWPYPADGADTFCRCVALPAMERGEEWHWTLRLRTSPDEIIGLISLTKGEHINRGFWIAPAFQNQGLMTEAVIATADYWFDVLGFQVLRAPKAIPNMASRRISEKTGMRVIAVEEGNYVGGRFPTEIWEITDQEWRAFRDRTEAENRRPREKDASEWADRPAD